MKLFLNRLLTTLFLLAVWVNSSTAQCVVGGFRTQTQGGWGANASGNNPGVYRDAKFSLAFPSGLVIGASGGKTLKLTTATKVNNFLPAGGTAGVLTSNQVDPTSSPAGVLAGQLVALTLNVGFDQYDPNFSSSPTLLKNQIINISSSPFNGMSVQQFLTIANNVVGGLSTAYTPSQVNTTASAINENYDNGTTNLGKLVCPDPPVISASSVNVTCNGGTNGSITLTVSGGTSPYTYSWSNGATTKDLTNLCAGTYTVTVSDATLQTATTSVTITAPGAISVSASSQTDVTCNGGNNGSITLSASGGTSPFTWSKDGVNFQSSSTFTNLTAGSYTFTAKDSKGCTKTKSVTINQPSIVNISVGTITNVQCFGESTGSVTLSANGCAGPYTWSSNGTTYQSSSTFSGLVAGNYTFYVKTANGCISTKNVTISQPASQVVISVSSQTNISCNGVTNGSVTLSATGGTSPYTWSKDGVNYQSSSTFGSLCAGNYTYRVKDSKGCVKSINITITEPTALVVSVSSQTNVDCSGGNSGTVTLSATGGISPYTWSKDGVNFQSGSTFNNLTAGSYTFTIKDANNCTKTKSVSITQPSALSLSIGSQTNVTCNAGNNGVITLSTSGGTSPYTWSKDGINFQSSATFNNLTAGSYTFTVKDSKGCTKTKSATITEPSAAAISVTSQQNVNCFGASTGSVTLSAGGCTGPYTWSKDGINFQSSSTFSGLTAGTYTFTVKSTIGCTTTKVVTVTQPSDINVSVTSQNNINCFGASNGSVTLAASGGTGPYTWSRDGVNYLSSSTFTGLAAGNYTFKAKDSKGCIKSYPLTISQPSAALSASVSSVINAGCFGANTGSASVTAAGGTSPYTYAWSNAATTSTISGVGAGSYSVTVSDINGCTATATATVGQPTAALSVSFNTTNGTCSNNNLGSSTANVSGGTSPYTYAWSSGSTASTASGLAAGTYTLTVTDANSCVSTNTVTITTVACCNVTAGGTIGNGQSNCGPFDPAALTSVTLPSGGLGTLQYQWLQSSVNVPNTVGNPHWSPISGANGATYDPGMVTQTTYYIRCARRSGCTQMPGESNIIGIIIHPVPSASATSTNAGCFGASTGSATVTATGGTSPYTYAWSTTATTSTISGVGAGTYSVTVSDINGCTATATAIVGQPAAALSVSFNTTNGTCSNNNLGSSTANVSGGTSPYTYSWSNGSTASTASGLAAGTYTLTVTDANSCVSTNTVTITTVACCNVTAGGTIGNGQSNCGPFDPAALTSVTLPSGGLGTLQYQWLKSSVNVPNTVGNPHWSPISGANGATYDPGMVTQTTYYIRCARRSGCTQMPGESNIIGIIIHPVPSASATSTNAGCFGANTGSATVTATGGTSPYTYAWSNTATTSTISGVGAGSYSVTVSDINGCTSTASATVGQPSADLAITLSAQQNVTCFGAGNGSVSLSATGGTGAYEWSMNDNTYQTSNTFNNLTEGTYTFHVKDANGCTKSLQVIITAPSAELSTSATTTNVTVSGGNNGSVTVTASGGTSPYTYLWNTSQTTATISNLIAGVYTITVTDANGCTTTSEISISQPPSTCSGYRTQTQGGWGASPSGNNPGTYLHANFAAAFPSGLSIGCTNTLNLSSAQAVTNFLPSGSTASALPSGSMSNPGGTYNNVLAGQLVAATLNIVFDETDPGFSATNSLLKNAFITTGTFAGWTVQQVVDEANKKIGGCASSYSFSDLNNALTLINQQFDNGNVTGSFLTCCGTMALTTTSTSATCFGTNTGGASVNATGGNAPYAYLWSNSATTQTASNLEAGLYQVIVTDQTGCMDTADVTVTEPEELVATINPVNANCITGKTGAITASVSGGITPYTFSWNTTPQVTTAALTNLNPGSYTVTVTDANGCIANENITITGTPVTFGYLAIPQPSSQLLTGNSFSFMTYGSVSGETFAWDFGDGTFSTLQNPVKNYSTYGIYNVSLTVTNAGGCTNVSYITVVVLAPEKSMDAVPNCNAVRAPITLTRKAIFPRDYTDWAGSNLKTRKVAQFDTTMGRLVAVKVITTGEFTTHNKVEITGNMAPGTVRLARIQTDGVMNCGGPGFLYGITPVSLVDSFYSTGFDGTIDYAGTSGRDFGLHSSSKTDSTVIANPTILDAYTGTDSVSFIAYTNTNTSAMFPTGNSKSIQQTLASDTVTVVYYYCPPVNCSLLTTTAAKTDATCIASSGAASVTISGGEAPYTISWSTGATTLGISGLAPGVYTYTVADINGCSVTGSVTIGVEQITIYSTKNGDWNDPSTWDVGRVPTICDDVVISTNHNVTLLNGFPKAACRDLTCRDGAELLIDDTLECRDYKSENPGQVTRVYGFLSVCTMVIDDNADVYACDNISISNCTHKNKPLQVINGGEMHPLGSPYCTSKPKVTFNNDSTDIDLSDVCSAIDVQNMEIIYGYVTMPPCLTIHGEVTVQPGGDVLGFEPTWAPTSSLVMNRIYTFEGTGTSTILWPNGNTNVPRTVTLTSNITVTAPKHIINRINVIDSNVTGAGFIQITDNAMVYICGGTFSSPPAYGNNVTTQYCDVQPGNPPAVIGENMPPGGFTGDLIISTNVQLGENIQVAGNVIVNSTGILHDSVYNFTTAQSVLVDSGAVVYVSKSGGLTGSGSLFGNIPSSISCGSTVVYVADSGNQQIDPRMDYGTVVLDGTAPKTFQSADYGICGDLTITQASGGVDMPQESNIILAGNVDQTVSTAQPTVVFDITATGTGTKEISGQVTVTGTLQVDSGVTVITGNQLTLVSRPGVDAIVGPLLNGADIQGTICWERYIPGGSSRRRYRFLSMPIWGQTFKDAWQDDIFITGPGTGGTPCAYNTTDTISMTQNSNGFDRNETGANTIFMWSELTGTWNTIQSAYDTIHPLRAYRTYVRGARYVEGCLLLTLMPDSVSATLIDACGPLVKFDQTVNLTRTVGAGNGWNYVSNPYPCPIDWNHPQWVAARTGIIDPTLWIFDPATNAYTSWHPVAGGTNGGTNIIGKDQSIFVRALQAGSMTFRENYKIDTLRAGFFGKTNPTALNRLAIKLTGAETKDEAVVYMNTYATHNYNPELDGFKLGYEEGSIAVSKKGMPSEKLTFAAIPVVGKSDTVALFTNLGALNASFTLSFDGFANISGYTYYLKDKYSNTTQLINAKNTTYEFGVDMAKDGSSLENRFELIIVKTATVPVAMAELKAVKNGNQVNVVWATSAEKNNSHFVVEFSSDAINFTELGSVKGAGNSSKLTSYLFTHVNPVNGINYYRLRQVSFDGSFTTSAVVSVDMSVKSVQTSDLTVFPVPASNQITVQFSGTIVAKNVTLSIVDLLGRTIIEKSTAINANKVSLDIQSLKPGAYMVTVNEGTGSVKQVKFIKE